MSISEFKEFHKTSSTRITKIQTLVDRLPDGYRTKSIMKDLKQEGISNVFSEASRRTIKEMGNIEFFELGETVRTTQCPSCIRYSKEGTAYCLFGKCLIDLVHVIKQGTRGERHGLDDLQYHRFTATAATTNVQKRGFTIIANRWKDDPSY